MLLPKVVTQLVLTVKALATARLIAMMIMPGMLLHMAMVLSKPSEGAIATVRTLTWNGARSNITRSWLLCRSDRDWQG